MMQIVLATLILLSIEFSLISLVDSKIVGSKSGSNQLENKNKKSRLLYPKLIPHPDTCYLIEFVADG